MNAHSAPESYSPPVSRDPANGTDPGSPKRAGGRLWAFIVVGLSLAAFYSLRDLPKWVMVQRHTAAAEKAIQNGDWDAAIAEMDKAVARDPSALTYAQRSHVYHQKASSERRSDNVSEHGKYRKTAELALADINQSIELKASPQWYSQRAIIHESLDRFRDAAEDWTSFLQMLNSTNDSIFLADGLNARAYMRALGEFEIAEGIEDAEKALRILPSVPSKRFNTEDTHAYLLHLNGESEKAIKIFERCLKTAEENLRIQQELAESVKNGEKPPQQLRIAQDAVAVILHHRGLAYQSVGQKTAAEFDFKKAIELGYDPEKGIR